MSEIANARINTFGTSPKADIASPDDPIIEIPLSDFQHVLDDMVSVYNQMAELVKDAGILRGRELARLTEDHAHCIKAERSPTAKLLLLNAYCKQMISKIREVLKSRPAEGGKMVQVVTKSWQEPCKLSNTSRPKHKKIPKDGRLPWTPNRSGFFSLELVVSL